MHVLDDYRPELSVSVNPPAVLGTGTLTDFAYQGNGFHQIRRRIADHHDVRSNEAARLYDMSVACQLAFRRAEGLENLNAALESCNLFRVARDNASSGALRLLALVAPGDLMTNTPLDFLTNHLNVRLDLLYLLPGKPLPAVIPDHDVAFFAAGEATPETLSRLCGLFAAWPRPALNDPRFLPAMQRDTLSRSLSGIPLLRSPPTVAVARSALEAGTKSWDISYPCLIRPHGSHAGSGLARVENQGQLRDYLRLSSEQSFYLTEFEDYRGPDGLYRKYRVAFIDRRPFLCHMAVSQHWMVHYLNAGMTESAAKRDQEAAAMAEFDTGFARRHAAAFSALHKRMGFDFYSIDCSETRDGRLLVFEADTAAIIHLMDPPDLFPYKQPQMRRVFDAFDDLLRSRAPDREARRFDR
ncbi:MAG TPA: hypothetical protein DDZ81_14750 [Acetobacteraceae bacterium]|jgi:hypothetical protein|nr:hypothetical protein [Acetobacteraceae bacterium]